LDPGEYDGGDVGGEVAADEGFESCLDKAFIERSDSHQTAGLKSGVSKSSHIRRTSSNRYRDEDIIDSKSVKSDKKLKTNRLTPANLPRIPQVVENQYNAVLCTRILKSSSLMPPSKMRFLKDKGVKSIGAHLMIDSFILLETIGQG
jgi:hypothetical protein